MLVTAAAQYTPQHLVDLVRPKGALVMPVGPSAGPFRLKRLYKCSDGVVTMCMFEQVEASRLSSSRQVGGLARGLARREP